MDWASTVAQWRQDPSIQSWNAQAAALLDNVAFDRLEGELRWFLSTLYADVENHGIQPGKIEGPDGYPTLLIVTERLKKYKPRITMIGVDIRYAVKQLDELYSILERTLQLRPEYAEARSAEQRKAIVSMVGAELVEAKTKLQALADFVKDVNSAYSSYFDAISLEYNVINAMSYYRNLYNNAPPSNIAPRKF